MPGDRAARPCRFFAPEHSIIIHDFMHQVLDQLLSHPAMPKPPTRCGVLGEKIIDQFDHHTIKAGALLVYSLLT